MKKHLESSKFSHDPPKLLMLITTCSPIVDCSKLLTHNVMRDLKFFELNILWNVKVEWGDNLPIVVFWATVWGGAAAPLAAELETNAANELIY